MSLKTAGIIGGIGPESTIDYYRRILAAHAERAPQHGAPSLLINSIDNQKMLGWVASGELEVMTAHLVAEVQRLERAGADFGVLAANTAHIVFDAVAVQVDLPLVSIIDATRAAAHAHGLTRLGLFGTRFTMQGRFYREAFCRAGAELIVPNSAEQDFIHEKYLTELLKGVFLPETREALLIIARRLRDDHAIDGLILGGTELPLILSDSSGLGIPFLDTTQIHVDAIVARLLEGE